MSSKDVAESVFIEIETKNSRKLTIGCIYRHHATSVSDLVKLFLSDLLLKIGKKCSKTILMGDFNVDLLNYYSHNETREYYDILSSNGFRPLIFQPTIVNSRSSTLIDNILINDIETFSHGGNIVTAISDHYPQFCVLDTFDNRDKLKRGKQSKRSFKNFNPNEFTEELKRIDWVHLLHGKSSSDAFNSFYATIEKLLDEMAPVKRLTRRELKTFKKPWITFGLLKSMSERDKIYKLFLKEKNSDEKSKLWLDYRQKRNLIKSLSRTSKRQYYIAFFEENKCNLKRTWEGIKNIININKKHRQNINSLNVNDTILTDRH